LRWDYLALTNESHSGIFVKRLKQGREEHLATLSNPATNHDQFQIQSRSDRRDRDANRAAGPSESSHSSVVPCPRTFSYRPTRLLAGPTKLDGMGNDRRPTRDSLYATTPTAVAKRAVMFGHDMSHVTCIAGMSVNTSTIENEPASNTGRHDHAEHVLGATSGTPTVLGQGEGNRIVMNRNGSIASKSLAHLLFERVIAPSWNVYRRHSSIRPHHRTTTADSHRIVIMICRSQYGVDQILDVFPQCFGRSVRDGRPHLMRNERTVRADKASSKFRTADIKAKDHSHRTIRSWSLDVAALIA
jgi:hypothetical protein